MMNEQETYINNEIERLVRRNNELERAVEYYKKLSDEVAGYNIGVDSKISLIKRELEQKNDGFTILRALHDVIGSGTHQENFFTAMLELILTTLKMDRSVILWKEHKNPDYKARWCLGYSKEELKTLQQKEYDLTVLNDRKPAYLLVSKSVKMQVTEQQLLKDVLLNFAVGVPIRNREKIAGWLIAGREKEAYPFYPPLTMMNIENFQVIAGFAEAVLSNLMLYKKLETANHTLEEYNKELEKKVQARTKDIEISHSELEEEKKKADDLLLNILPSDIARELKRYGSSKAKRYNKATILFTDFVNFTRFSEQLSPEELVAELDKCFRAFDEIATFYRLEKIKTIGDAYMCANGLASSGGSPSNVIYAALDMRDYIREFSAQRSRRFKSTLQMRIGIHNGPVIAGVVGMKKFSFDIWGDTVNISSRMESGGLPDKVNVSGVVYELAKDDFDFEPRGKIKIKNGGDVDMYFAEKKSVGALNSIASV